MRSTTKTSRLIRDLREGVVITERASTETVAKESNTTVRRKVASIREEGTMTIGEIIVKEVLKSNRSKPKRKRRRKPLLILTLLLDKNPHFSTQSQRKRFPKRRPRLKSIEL